MLLICVSLIAKDVEHLSYFLAIVISSIENSLFGFWAIFRLGCLFFLILLFGVLCKFWMLILFQVQRC